MKKYLFILACALAFAACGDNNKPDDPGKVDGTQVGINSALPKDMAWVEGDAIGVISSCSRGDEAGVCMSANKPARLLASKAGQSVSFKAASDADKLLSQEGDRSFKFYATYPFPEGVDNFKALPVGADSIQTYSANPLANMTFIASASALNVLAPVTLNMESPFALLKIMMPKDVIPGEKSTLKSLTLSAKNTNLAQYGNYNIEKREYTVTDSASFVTLEFPAGLVLEEKNTPVYFAVAPFTVPDGGLKLKVETQTGETTMYIWDGDAGKKINSGEVVEWTNEIHPVVFPVHFPLGRKTYSEEEGEILVFSKIGDVYKYQPRWSTDHRWIAYDGATPLDAYAQWHNVMETTLPAELLESYHTIYENVNSGGKISSCGIKGIWTGDYMEFVLPVVGFKAGTTLNLNFPTYGRQHPMFWDIQYLDGGEWKCNRTTLHSDLPAKDERVSPAVETGELIECEATFVSNRGGNIHDIDITFANAIDEGFVKIRMVCVHGEYQNGGGSDTKFDYIRSTPWIEGGTRFGAPFYFYCADNYFGETPDIDESLMDFVISIKKD